jgi:hypothetical protein
MKKLLAGITLLASMSSFASNCDVSSVLRLEGFSSSLQPHLEKVLEEKGYNVKNDGLFYEDYNVPVSELKIREDLLVENKLIATSTGQLSENDNSMCTRWVSGHISCSYSFSLYKVNADGNLAVLANVESKVKKKPNLFNSERRITNKFYKNIIKEAKRQIPACI